MKGQIAINPKRLYKADQTAVSELLKVAGFLYGAGLPHRSGANPAPTCVRAVLSRGSEPPPLPPPCAEAHLAAKPDAVNPRGAAPAPAPDFLSVVKEVDVKQFRKLASEITALGAKLSDGLQAEAETLREARAKAVQRAERLDVSQVEAAVRDALGETREKLEEVRRAVEELSAREQAQQGKLQKRLAEVRRAEERLETLQDVRPVYMDEYEKMEGELQALFGSFLERQRTLTFLESQLERHRAGEEAEAEAHRAALLQMQRRLRDEEMNELRGSARLDVDGFDGIPPPQQHAAAGNGVRFTLPSRDSTRAEELRR